MYNCELCLSFSKPHQQQFRSALSVASLYTEQSFSLRSLWVDPTQQRELILCKACHTEVAAIQKDRRAQALAAAQNPETSSRRLEEISRCTQEREIREALARNPNTPPSLLDGLSRELLPEIEQNPAFFLFSLEDPSRVQSWRIHYYYERLQRGLPAPSEALSLLRSSPETWIRARVAGDKTAEPELLRALSQDQEWYVRSAVAGNPRTPRDTLIAMAERGEQAVLRALSGNESVPARYRDELLRDDSLWNERDDDMGWSRAYLDKHDKSRSINGPRAEYRRHKKRIRAKRDRQEEIQEQRRSIRRGSKKTVLAFSDKMIDARARNGQRTIHADRTNLDDLRFTQGNNELF
jgi:hypothetical protein